MLCDSFNTPKAIEVLRELISKTNVYINMQPSTPKNVRLIENIAQWVSNMLRMFGLGEGEKTEIGWGQVDTTGSGANVCFLVLKKFFCKTAV